MPGRTIGIDWTLPDAPPLLLPPLSLLLCSKPIIQVDPLVTAAQDAAEQRASAEADVEAAYKRLADAPEEEKQAAASAVEDARNHLANAEAWAALADSNVADAQRWERGFQYLPEMSNAESMEVFSPDSGTAATDGALKSTTATQDGFYWYDPFEVVAHDDRSAFGYPHANFLDRAQRAQRALLAHESWQIENEFWTGSKIPTNYHLSASPNTVTTSPHRTISAFTNPTAAPTTTLGTAVGLAQSLAALDQAIADSDAGIGMIHATPYVVQRWMAAYPFIRDPAGKIYTVNFNLIVPGYGYPGTGPDTPTRTVTDGVTNGTTTVTSATAAFTQNDVGRFVSGTDIPAGATIVAVGSATSVTISVTATGSHTGNTLTVNGTGGDATTLTKQWVYATDGVYSLRSAVMTYPHDLRQTGPELNVDNSVDVRAERSVAMITNRLLRAAVLVDTTQS